MPGEGRLSQAGWIWPRRRSFVVDWTKSQAAAMVATMTGHSLRESDPAQRTEGAIIAVGPEAVSRVALGAPSVRSELDAVREASERLGEEEYLLRTVAPSGGPTVVVLSGGGEEALAWACFELFELLGCRFTISGDIVPERADPVIPTIDILRRPVHRVRGIWFSYCFATNSIMSLVDYEALFGQMVKLRLNRFITYHFENEPFVDFSYRGERKVVGDISHPTSAYISYGRHFSGSYLVEDLPIGSELFGRDRVAPLELQHVRSSAEALTEGVRFLRTVFRTARHFGIAPWISVLPSFVPMNFTKYTRRMPRPHMHWSALVSFTDPVLDEMNRNRIEAILRDYPDIAGLNLGIPEGYYEDPYPQSIAAIERERPRYREALEIHKRHWGRYWNDDQALLEAHIDRDIGFAEILKRSIAIAREVAPGLSLGVMTVCKAYLLTLLHEDLPLDVSFVDIESRSLWTMDGAPLHLFDRMKGRECAVIPRAVDDGSMAGLQYNLELYALDRFLQSPDEHGTAGLVIQTTHVRGNEHNISFLAKGMWDPTLAPATFYRDYAAAVVGAEAGTHLERAFAVLETNEQELGGRGQGNLPWNKVPMQIEILRKFRNHSQPMFAVPCDARFVASCEQRSVHYRRAIGRLDEAAAHFRLAARILAREGAGASSKAVRELSYLTEKQAGYRDHLICLIELGVVYDLLLRAFATDATGARRLLLEQAHAKAVGAAALAVSSTNHFAHAVEHPTDLGVLWSVETSMVIGTGILVTYVGNLVAFARGEEYWEPVAWERLFGGCPYPAYSLSEMTLSADYHRGEYEPG